MKKLLASLTAAAFFAGSLGVQPAAAAEYKWQSVNNTQQKIQKELKRILSDYKKAVKEADKDPCLVVDCNELQKAAKALAQYKKDAANAWYCVVPQADATWDHMETLLRASEKETASWERIAYADYIGKLLYVGYQMTQASRAAMAFKRQIQNFMKATRKFKGEEIEDAPTIAGLSGGLTTSLASADIFSRLEAIHEKNEKERARRYKEFKSSSATTYNNYLKAVEFYNEYDAKRSLLDQISQDVSGLYSGLRDEANQCVRQGLSTCDKGLNKELKAADDAYMDAIEDAGKRIPDLADQLLQASKGLQKDLKAWQVELKKRNELSKKIDPYFNDWLEYERKKNLLNSAQKELDDPSINQEFRTKMAYLKQDMKKEMPKYESGHKKFEELRKEHDALTDKVHSISEKVDAKQQKSKTAYEALQAERNKREQAQKTAAKKRDEARKAAHQKFQKCMKAAGSEVYVHSLDKTPFVNDGRCEEILRSGQEKVLNILKGINVTLVKTDECDKDAASKGGDKNAVNTGADCEEDVDASCLDSAMENPDEVLIEMPAEDINGIISGKKADKSKDDYSDAITGGLSEKAYMHVMRQIHIQSNNLTDNENNMEEAVTAEMLDKGLTEEEAKKRVYDYYHSIDFQIGDDDENRYFSGLPDEDCEEDPAASCTDDAVETPEQVDAENPGKIDYWGECGSSDKWTCDETLQPSSKDWTSMGEFIIDDPSIFNEEGKWKFEITVVDKKNKKTKITQELELTEIPLNDEFFEDRVNIGEAPPKTFEVKPGEKIDWLQPIELDAPPQSSGLVEKAAGQALGGLLGGGGGLSLGGQPRQKGPKKPKLTRRPDYKLHDIAGPDGQGIQVSGGMKNGQPEIFVRVSDSPDKGVPHLIVMENIEDGRFLVPVRVRIVELWVKITLSVSWTKTYYRDGQKVGEESGGWSTSWKQRVGRYMQVVRGPGIWQQLGTPPFNGAQGVLADFELPAGQTFDPTKWRVIIHITKRSRTPGRVATQPFAADITGTDNNEFIFADGFESGDTSAWSSSVP